jgi:hypothetical protein
MTSNKLRMPDFEKYQQFPIDDNKGWGNKFDGKQMSIIL